MSPSHRMERPSPTHRRRWLRGAVDTIRRGPDPGVTAADATADRLAAGGVGVVVLVLAIGTYIAATRGFSPAAAQDPDLTRAVPSTAAATAPPTLTPGPGPSATPGYRAGRTPTTPGMSSPTAQPLTSTSSALPTSEPTTSEPATSRPTRTGPARTGPPTTGPAEAPTSPTPTPTSAAPP